jgi:hypothetical protein
MQAEHLVYFTVRSVFLAVRAGSPLVSDSNRFKSGRGLDWNID